MPEKKSRSTIEFTSFDPTELKSKLERGEFTRLIECFLEDLDGLLKSTDHHRLVVGAVLDRKIGLGYNKIEELFKDGSD